jgi:uncharacterized RDD family membrane protein YckC
MKNIEIITSQNVVLQYELADLRERAIAFLIDMVCLIVSLSIFSAIGGGILSGSETALAVFWVLISCVFIFYSLAFELWNNGQSIGKKAMRIQVIKMAGGRATFSDYVARWVFRLIDIYFSLGAIASILVVSSSKAQRIGDVVANTAVVKMVPKMDLDLKDLLTIHKSNATTPQYTQAKRLHEEDALLIKQTLERHRRFRNDAHDEALELLVLRIKNVLDIDHVEGDHVRFLHTVLQNYIILSR